MSLNNLPLVSVSTVKAALEQISATSSPSATKPADALPNSAQGSTVVVEAKVVAVQVQGQQVLLTLSANGQQFQVQSDLPLPIDTKLTLKVTTYPQEVSADGKQEVKAEIKPEVLVQKIVLPENKTTPPTQALIQRFISERLALLDAATQKPTTNGDTYLRPGVNANTQASIATNTQASALANTQASSATTNNPTTNNLTTSSLTSSSLTSSNPANSTRVSELLSALSLLQPSNPLSKTLPAQVQQVLQQWQQHLPNIQQLAQAEAVRESIQHSGVQYEKRVMQLLEQMQASPQTEPKALFKALWAKTGAAVAPLGNAVASSISGSLGSSTSQAFGNRLEQILKAVHSALEQPVPLTTDKLTTNKLVTEQLAAKALDAEKVTPEKLAADKASLTPPSLLQALLGSNHKAVISRALLAWAQTLADRPGQSGQPSTGATAARSLPLTPFPNGPEAFQQLQRALAHIEHEQVRQLQPNEPWQLSVPLLFKEGGHQQEVRLELYKDDQDSDKNDGEAKESLWRLRLFFDLQNLGSLDADIELRFPNVKVTFWSKQQETLNALSQALKPLQNKLTALGAEVEDMQVKFGQLPEKSRNLINQRLVDAKA